MPGQMASASQAPDDPVAFPGGEPADGERFLEAFGDARPRLPHGRISLTLH